MSKFCSYKGKLCVYKKGYSAIIRSICFVAFRAGNRHSSVQTSLINYVMQRLWIHAIFKFINYRFLACRV